MTVTTLREVGPADTGWKYLGVRVLGLAAGDHIEVHERNRESALVIVHGEITVVAENALHRVSRTNPFTEMGDVLYLPPGKSVTISAAADSEIAIGTAPAIGRYPMRLITAREMSSELRGGGPARRQVTSPLAAPLPAERLNVYEAYVPRGAWAGWPPHRHDGFDGSPYLEETYYFHFDRPSGYGMHRNYATDGQYDQHVVVHDCSLVTVPHGYHVCAAAPAANMWILNFLAGSPEDRPLPPIFDAAEVWISTDWERDRMTLPAVTPL